LSTQTVRPETPPDWFRAVDVSLLEAWRDDHATWTFWARWWDGAKNRTQLHWDLQTKVALIEDGE